MSDTVATRIERREYKYVVDVATAERVRRAITPFCKLDRFCLGRPGHRYTIDSLYLDTPGRSLFYAGIEQRTERFKLRVRGYGPGSPVFVEEKRRVNDVIVKARGRVGADWARLFEDPATPLPSTGHPAEDAAVARVVLLARTYHALPAMLVRYDREAYESTVDPYTRISFDTRVCSQPAERYSLACAETGWRAVDDAVAMRAHVSSVVLELKFGSSCIPTWLVRIVRRLDLQREAFSKYNSSVIAWHGRFQCGARSATSRVA